MEDSRVLFRPEEYRELSKKEQQHLALAYEKAIELGIYNRWTGKMREALGRLNDVLYPPMHEIGFDVRTTGPLPFPKLLNGPRRGKQPVRIERQAPRGKSAATSSSPAKPKTGSTLKTGGAR